MTYKQMESVRIKNGLSIKEFSRLIGVSWQTYYHYKTARNIPPTVVKIVKMIEMHPHVIIYLLSKINNPSQVKYKYRGEILVELVRNENNT